MTSYKENVIFFSFLTVKLTIKQLVDLKQGRKLSPPLKKSSY